jgi:hypothetical protein
MVVRKRLVTLVNAGLKGLRDDHFLRGVLERNPRKAGKARLAFCSNSCHVKYRKRKAY